MKFMGQIQFNVLMKNNINVLSQSSYESPSFQQQINLNNVTFSYELENICTLYNILQQIQQIQAFINYSMENSFLERVDNKIQSAKLNISNVFKECTPKIQQFNEIDFQDVISQKQDILDTQADTIQKNDFSSKVQQAIKNSSIAKILYHNDNPEKLTQQFIQHSQVVKEIQNEVSLVNVSKILQLKKDKVDLQEHIQMSGILSKYSPSLFGGCSSRYCTLSKNKFVYMENQDKKSPVAGFINFNILSFSVRLRYQGLQVDSFEIKVDKGDKNFIFKGQNSFETLNWFQKINQFIEESEGKVNNVTALSNYHRFWRKEYITQKQFQRTAKTGDILLFRGKKTSALLQRAISGEEYDHIGVVLLNAFDQILIFEANGGFGVGICPWKKFVKNKWFEDQQIIAIRHLSIKRTEQFFNDVTKFVQSNIGKEYKFSFRDYLMSRHSDIDNQKNSYFCSSLVAKLYKKLGLLDRNVSSSRYMPYDFSDKEKLKILDGKHGDAQLEREKIIVFENRQRNKIFEKTT